VRPAPGASHREEDLAPGLGPQFRLADPAPQRRGTLVAVDRDHFELAREPAVKRNPEQFALHQKRRVPEQRDEAEGLPRGLMLGGDEASAFRQLLRPPYFELDAGNDSQQPKLETPVNGERRHGPASRSEEERAPEHDEQRRRHIEEKIEQQRARHPA
jgi:hypothetical protein